MAESSGDKKHEATDRKRRQAREQGQIVKSQDLSSAALLLAAVGVLWTLGEPAASQIATLMIESLGQFTPQPAVSSGATHRLFTVGWRFAAITTPILLAMFVAAIAVNVAQTGLLLTPTKLAPKLRHISPLSGFKRIASLQGLARLGFGLFKVGIIGAVAYVSVRSNLDSLLQLSGLAVGPIASVLFRMLMGTAFWIGLALLILAVAEYAFQKWKMEQDLRMTDQEVRDEMKDSEGDPQLTARRRQIQRQMMMQRAESEVPSADVVVTNPTELAIAIRYDPTSMPAPILLAKGAGLLAQRIRRVALENGVPVVERKPLAQMLYKHVEVGEAIPPDQYQAVAEVLRYVYQLQGKQIPKAA
ncbi:MAG: EscU/YscU/HrcU family type III secretion system export apparatus switch protein [Planctomycetota bacterium]